MKNNTVVRMVVCLLAARAFAAEIPDENACRIPKIVFAHINGVKTTEVEAQDQLRKYIQPVVQDRYKYLGLDQFSTLEFKLLYNSTQILLQDFSETFHARLLEEKNPLAGKSELKHCVICSPSIDWRKSS